MTRDQLPVRDYAGVFGVRDIGDGLSTIGSRAPSRSAATMKRKSSGKTQRLSQILGLTQSGEHTAANRAMCFATGVC
jgi:hypothetical protein